VNALYLVAVAALGILLLLVLIVRRKLPPFAALLVVSLLIGIAAQWPHPDPARVLKAMQEGMGNTLGFVAIVVGLGAMLGGMLERSGAAEVMARGLLERLGARRADFGLALAGFIISIPVFFDVAFVLLVPLLYGLAQRSGRGLLQYALPLLAGMVVTHAFVPPTPGPIGVAAILKADLGIVIVLGIVAGLPATLLAGPLLTRWLGSSISGRVAETANAAVDPGNASESTHPAPSLGLVVGLILLPIVLIVGGTVSAAVAAEPSASNTPSLVFGFLGHPFVALLGATLLSFWLLGTRRGLSRDTVAEVSTRALEPAGIIILVTGAGGVLKQVLIDTEVGKVLADRVAATGVSPLVLGFFIAWVVRVMQGSATVAMLTAAGLLVPLLESVSLSPWSRGLLVISIAAGATATSHVNDSGFWLVSRYLGLSVTETLKTWTVMTTVAGFGGLGATLLIEQLLG